MSIPVERLERDVAFAAPPITTEVFELFLQCYNDSITPVHRKVLSSVPTSQFVSSRSVDSTSGCGFPRSDIRLRMSVRQSRLRT